MSKFIIKTIGNRKFKTFFYNLGRREKKHFIILRLRLIKCGSLLLATYPRELPHRLEAAACVRRRLLYFLFIYFAKK